MTNWAETFKGLFGYSPLVSISLSLKVIAILTSVYSVPILLYKTIGKSVSLKTISKDGLYLTEDLKIYSKEIFTIQQLLEIEKRLNIANKSTPENLLKALNYLGVSEPKNLLAKYLTSGSSSDNKDLMLPSNLDFEVVSKFL